MIKKQLAVMMLTAAFILPATSSNAVESSAFAQVTSNYVFRGQTQTNDDPAIQAGYDIKQSKDDLGWYAGVFGSNVTDGFEVDLFGGWKGSFGQQSNMGYDVGAVLYNYSDNIYTDVTELYAGINYETAFLKLYLGNGSGISSYKFLDAGASFIIMQDIDLNLHAGRRLTSKSWNYVGADLKMEIKGFDLGLGLTLEDEGVKNDVEFFVTVGKTFDL